MLWMACSHTAFCVPDPAAKARPAGRWIRILGGVALVSAALHTGAWLLATGWIEAESPGFFAAAAASGWTIHTAEQRRAGWPWTATVRLSGVTAHRGGDDVALQWKSDEIDVSLAPGDLAALHVSAHGNQEIGLGPEAGLGWRADRAVLRIPFAGAPWTFESRGMVIDAARPIRVGGVTGQGTPAAMEASATDVRMTPPLPAPFDSGLAMSASVSSAPPFPAATPTAAAAALWRAQGGRARAPSLEVRWGPLHATGSGDGGLDANLQPVGQAILSVEGAPALVDALSQDGVLQPGPASAVRAVLGLLALAAGGGPIRLPVSLADHVVAVAGFPLARLAPVVWP